MARKIVSRNVRSVKRTKAKRSAKPSRCPYCESKAVDAQAGWAECLDCGKTWSY